MKKQAKKSVVWLLAGLVVGGVCAFTCCDILAKKGEETTCKQGHTVVALDAVEPTCSTVGKTQGSYCSVCNTVLKKPTDIPMLEHSLVEKETHSATCEEDGFTGGVKCTSCDYETDGEVIPALGHSYDEGRVTIEATCTTNGEKSYTCTTCEEIKLETISAIGHVVESGRCLVCGIPATNGSTGEGAIVVRDMWYIDDFPAMMQDREKFGGFEIIPGTGSTVREITMSATSISFDSKIVYSIDTGWIEDGYRYWNFGVGAEIPKVLYDWLIENSKECSGVISFSINGEKHLAEFGMTWSEWVASEYNTIGAEISSSTICFGHNVIEGASSLAVIVRGADYSTYEN